MQARLIRGEPSSSSLSAEPQGAFQTTLTPEPAKSPGEAQAAPRRLLVGCCFTSAAGMIRDSLRI